MKKMMSVICLLVLQLVISPSLAQSPVSSARQSNDTLDKIFTEYFHWKLKTYPEWATLEGQTGYNHLVEDFSMEAIRDKVEKCQQFYERSRKLEATSEDYKLYKQTLEVKREIKRDGALYFLILSPGGAAAL